jgi:glycosyltransferase involved in cell wall biosynthesis
MHVDRKLLHLGLRVLRRALDRGISAGLDVVGDGPCSAVWKDMAMRLCLSDHCAWHGALAHERALAVMADGEALLFTSVQDATATVVIEALQSGVPVICHGACGFGGVIHSSCGIKVPATNPSVSIEGFADAISELARSPALRRRLADGALECAKAMTWQLKAAEMSVVYQSAFDSWSR